MSSNPEPEQARLPELPATMDTLGSAGQPVERTLEGPSARPSLPPTTPKTPPELANLQGYEIVKELGRGGMGVVYLARNKLINRFEVLKVMNRALVGRPEAVERFLQEIRSAGQLNHGNVAATFSAYQLGDLLVLAMEYVEGDDLAKVVHQRGALPIPRACYCVHQAATALQRGVELGMVHRDIKPSNILLAKQGKRLVVKVIDFGLAKAKSEVTNDHDLTRTNQMMGTPGYSAPEQLNDAKSADTRADIYALGCTLYHLLAGEPPFRGTSALAIVLAQEAQTVRPLREVRPEVSEGLAQVVARMMAHKPEERFGQPGQVAAALLPFIKGAKESPEDSASAPVQAAAALVPGIKTASEVKLPPVPASEAPADERTERTIGAEPSAPAIQDRKNEPVRCPWTGNFVHRSESGKCRLTGLRFSRPVLNARRELAPLRLLLDGDAVDTNDGTRELLPWLMSLNLDCLKGAKTVRYLESPTSAFQVVCVEVSGWLGLRVRHVGLLLSVAPEKIVVGRQAVGRRGAKGWQSDPK